jgi:hypothetical protein
MGDGTLCRHALRQDELLQAPRRPPQLRPRGGGLGPTCARGLCSACAAGAATAARAGRGAGIARRRACRSQAPVERELGAQLGWGHWAPIERRLREPLRGLISASGRSDVRVRAVRRCRPVPCEGVGDDGAPRRLSWLRVRALTMSVLGTPAMLPRTVTTGRVRIASEQEPGNPHGTWPCMVVRSNCGPGEEAAVE